MKNPNEDSYNLHDKSAMIVDRGASEPFAVRNALFESIRKVDAVQVELAEGIMETAGHNGMVPVDPRSIILKLCSVYYALRLSLNNLSSSGLDEHGISMLIAKDYCALIDRRKPDTVMIKISRKKTDGLHVVRIKSGEALVMKATN